VGREAIIDEIVQAATGPREAVVFDLEGPRGSGRSRLLDDLHKRLAQEDGCKVVTADLAPYVGAAAADTEARPRLEALGEYQILLQDLAGELPGARDGFSDRVRALAAAGADDAASAEVRADDLASALATQFANVLAGERLVILVDNASASTGDLSRWLRRLLHHLVVGGGAVAVVFRGVAPGEPPNWPGRVLRRTMPSLSEDDVAAHLADRLGSRPSDEVVDVVVAWSGGYARAVDAAADLVGATVSATQLAGVLEAPPASVIAKIKPALEHLHTGDERLRAAVEVAASLRNFDLESVTVIVDDLELEPPDDLELVLEGLPFVRPGARDGTRAFCEFFRILVERELKGARPAAADESRFVKLHRAATGYYKDKLRLAVEDRGEVYASWERLERPEIQTLVLDFLYHAARFPDRDWARFQLATLYFDVFWWWGWYLEAPFASALLDEWERSEREWPDEGEFIDEFRRFQRSYVPYSELWPSALDRRERWVDALDALGQLRRRLLDPRPVNAEERHVRGITASFMGDALRHLDLEDRDADRRYGEALAAFRENAEEAAQARESKTARARVEDDDWCIPWALYFLSDLAWARGELAEAARLAREALTAAADGEDDDRDYEVIANCHRVLGDTLFEHDAVKAFREYLRAVFAAYAFHAAPFPDGYTRLFHREQTSRALERLRTVAATRPDQAREICNELSSWRLTGVDAPELARMLDERSWDELQTGLFPREPHLDELDRETDYAQRARLIQLELGPELLQPSVEEGPSFMGRMFRRRGDGGPVHEDPEPHDRGFSTLLETAVGPQHFAVDDEAWPRWWKDELAPAEWQSLDADERLPEELEAALQDAIATLPPRRREVLELRDVRGWSARSVSRELDITETDQTIMLHRARSAVRRALDPKFVRREP
jgi:hypothetical protein